jgi:hypothetical protein
MNQEILHDSYEYAGGNQLDGCWLKYPGKKNKTKREECHALSTKEKTSSIETDKMLAQAVLAKSTKTTKEEGLSAMAITGIIVGSLLAITLMVVVIKKVKSK